MSAFPGCISLAKGGRMESSKSIKAYIPTARRQVAGFQHPIIQIIEETSKIRLCRV